MMVVVAVVLEDQDEGARGQAGRGRHGQQSVSFQTKEPNVEVLFLCSMSGNALAISIRSACKEHPL